MQVTSVVSAKNQYKTGDCNVMTVASGFMWDVAVFVKKTYDILQKIEDFDWRCIGCKSPINELKNEIISLKEEKNSLLKENEVLLERLIVIENKMAELKNDIKKELASDIKENFMEEIQIL